MSASHFSAPDGAGLNGDLMRAWTKPALMFLVVVIAPALSPERAQAAEHTWKDYNSAKYAFQICYPSDLLKGRGELQAGDGQTFSAGEGASLAVWGGYLLPETKALDTDPDRYVASLGRGAGVSYRTVHPSWFVISGGRGDQTFYHKTIHTRGRFATLELTYAKALSGIYNPVIGRVQKCFKQLPGPF